VRSLAVLGVLLLALLAAGCGSDEDAEQSESAAAPPASSEPLPSSSELAPGETLTEPEFSVTEPGGASVTVPPDSSAAGATELAISVWELGKDGGEAKEYTLTCDPAGGTLPEPEAACTALAGGAVDFEPVPPDAACTMIYGGAAVAEVTGTVLGKPVEAEFSRQDGCHIDKWDSATTLLPADLEAGLGGDLFDSTSTQP
jgi:hypothetical protein